MKDIWINDSGFLQIANGDLVVGDADNQHVFLLLTTQPGQWGEHPTCGVGLPAMLLDNELLYWQHKTRQQLEQDGLKIEKLNLLTDKIELIANYNN